MAPNTERRLTRYFELVSFMVSFPYQPRWESNSARWLGCRFEAVDVFFIRNEPVPLFVKGIFDILKADAERPQSRRLCIGAPMERVGCENNGTEPQQVANHWVGLRWGHATASLFSRAGHASPMRQAGVRSFPLGFAIPGATAKRK